MKNENEKTNIEGNENKQHNWIEDLADKVKKLDTEFPLSGGETEEDLESAIDSDEKEKTSFFDDLDTEFPLSGGEVER